MGTYGLNNDERDVNILRYNHALFENMACFTDLVWEVNLDSESVYVMHDSIASGMQGRLFGLKEAARRFAETYLEASEQAQFMAILSPDTLQGFAQQAIFDFHLIGVERSHTWRFVITPVGPIEGHDDDAEATGRRLYVSARDVQGETDDEIHRLRTANADLSRMLSERKKKSKGGKDSKDKKALRRTTDELRDMVALLTERFVKVLLIDIDDDSFEEMRVEDIDHSAQAGYSRDIRTWLVNYCENENVHPDDRERYLAFAKLDGLKEELLAGGMSRSIEYRRIIDGNFRWARMELTKSIAYSASNPKVLLCVSDIHQEKMQTEALLLAIEHANRANAAKTDFLSSMSHDIRTPMNAIMGMTEIAKEHLDDKGRVADCLAKISTSSNHLLDLINGVLDMNKIEAGKMTLSMHDFNLRQLVDDVVAMVQPLIAKRGHRFTLNMDGLRHENVTGDAQRLRQVFVNMLSNSVKYTAEGGDIRMTVDEMRSRIPGYGFFGFTFEDNGMGIDPSFLPHLFEPFARAQDSRTDTTQGTGLGLPISRNIVHMMSGDISVESTVGEGSKFIVVLYLKLQSEQNRRLPDEASGAQGISAKLERGKFAGMRALLVEDNDINAEIACEILGMTGLEVDRVGNGQEAVAAMDEAEDGCYDIVFMDVQMPVMNGYEATRAIRGSDRGYLQHVPIVAMTANAFSDDVQDAFDAGMNGHVAKPLDVGFLQATLNRLLDPQPEGEAPQA